MNGHADYIDLPNGKRMELSASIPDIEEVPGPLSDEEKALIEMLEMSLKHSLQSFTQVGHCGKEETSTSQSAGK